MKIFYFIDSLMFGGGESQMTQVALRLHEAGHEITVGVMRATGPFLPVLKEAGIPVLEFNVRGKLASFRGILQILRLSRFLRREKFEVVHTQDLWSNMMGILASRLAGVNCIISTRYDLAILPWYTPFRRRFLRHIQELSTVVVANSEGVRQFLIDRERFDPKLLRVIYNGIETGIISAGDRREIDKSAASSDQLVAVTANMRFAFKGHRQLIDAAALLAPNWPNLKLVLFGEGELRPELEAQVQRLGIERNFIFAGGRSDVKSLLPLCDLAVLPSLTEGLPNAVLEYMAAGLPVVATRVGGIPELITDGHTGRLVPPGEPRALADAIEALLKNPRAAKNLGMAARQHVVERFSYGRLLRELEGLYRDGRSWPDTNTHI
jgi:L-malate glycosyltransferase